MFIFRLKTMLYLLLFCHLPFLMLDAVYINRFNTTTNGGLTFTGNTLGLSKFVNQNNPGTSDAAGAFITIDLTQQVGTYPPGTTLNYMQNSSTAVLDLPPGSTILYAELIWSGSYGFSNQITGNEPDQPITLITPQQIGFQITPDPATAQKAVTPGTVNMGNYTRSQNVTSIIQMGGAGIYTVGGIPATIGPLNNTNNAAGWTLAVAFQNDDMITSNLTIFVGCEQASYTVTPVQISGFSTPPSGTFTGRLFISAIEGDANKTGDHMLFGQTPTLTIMNNSLFGMNNPVNNFFASQINTFLPYTFTPLNKFAAMGSGMLDTRGSFGNMNANAITATIFPGDRQGYDITSIDVSNTLTTNQTVAYALGTTTGDDYTTNALGLQIQVNAPIIVAMKQVDATTSAVNNELTYTINLSNEGTSTAFGVTFKDLLQPGLTLVPNSLTVNGMTIEDADLNAGVAIGDLVAPTDTGMSSAVVQFRVRINSYPATGDTYADTGTIDYIFIANGTTSIPLVTTTNTVSTLIPPTVTPDTGVTTINTPLNGTSVLANDRGNGLVVISNTQGINGGTAVVNPDGTYLYTPPLNFTGVDIFTYTVQDSSGNILTTTVTITIVPLSPPTIVEAVIKKTKFLDRTEYCLFITWKEVKSDGEVSSYRIYHKGKIVAEFLTGTPLVYKKCLGSKKSAHGYSVTAVYKTGQESVHVKLRIKHE